MSEIRIEKAKSENVPVILSMMKDFAVFERLSEYATATEEDYREALFSKNFSIECLLAYFENEVAGYALFFTCFSSFRGWRGLYLEDLYIKEEFRGKKIGEEVLNHLAQIAKERNFKYIEWEILDWNEPAIRFYKKLGAEPMEGCTKYRLKIEFGVR